MSLGREEFTYIPNDKKIRESAIATDHFGHPGVVKTLEQLTRNHWWLLIINDVEKYVRGCANCQMVKMSNQKM